MANLSIKLDMQLHSWNFENPLKILVLKIILENCTLYLKLENKIKII